MSQQVGPLQLLPGERRGGPCKGGVQKQHRVAAKGGVDTGSGPGSAPVTALTSWAVERN